MRCDLEFFLFKFLDEFGASIGGVRRTVSLIFMTVAASILESDKETSVIKAIIHGTYIIHNLKFLKQRNFTIFTVKSDLPAKIFHQI